MMPLLPEIQLGSDALYGAKHNNVVLGRHGFVCYNKHDIVVGASMKNYGEYFETEVEMFSRFIRPGNRVMDIGANIGTHTLAMARLVGPTGYVYAFEAQRQVFQTLCATIALNGLENVDCELRAVSDKKGFIKVEELNFSVPGNYGGLALGTSQAGKQVPTISIDEYIMNTPIQFMKVDVEGMEVNVLNGAFITIKTNKPVLYVEADKPKKSEELIDAIYTLGYEPHWHLPLFFNKNNFFKSTTNIHSLGFIDSGQEYYDSIGFAINLLCVPKGTKINTNDLLAVENPKEHPLIRGKTRFHP